MKVGKGKLRERKNDCGTNPENFYFSVGERERKKKVKRMEMDDGMG